MFCHKCGAQVADGAAFCHKCGTKIVYEDTEPQASNLSRTNEPASDVHSQSNTHSHHNMGVYQLVAAYRMAADCWQR